MIQTSPGIAGEGASSPSDGERPGDSGDASPSEPSLSPPPKKGHGRNGAEDYTGAEQIDVSHESLQPGDDCPDCRKGTLYDTQIFSITSRCGGSMKGVGQAPRA